MNNDRKKTKNELIAELNKLRCQIDDLKKNISRAYPEWAYKIIEEVEISDAIKNDSWKGETSFQGPNRREITAPQVIMPHKSKDGELEFISTIVREISELKLSEKALEVSEKKFRTLVDHAADAIFLNDIKGRILDANRQACNSLGYTRDELLKMNVEDIATELSGYDSRMSFWRKLKADRPITFEEVHQRKDGTKFPVEVRLSLFNLEGEKSFLALVRDITYRKQVLGEIKQKNIQLEFANEKLHAINEELQAALEEVEAANEELIETHEELRTSEEQFRMLFDHAADAIFLHNMNGKIIDVNKIGCEELGYTRDEILKMYVDDIDVAFSENYDGKEYWDKLMPDQHVTIEGVHKRKDNSIFPVEVRISLLKLKGEKAMLAIARDITEREKTQEIIIQTEKMMTIGGLAAGMAHEINNPLGIILQGIQMSQNRLSIDNKNSLNLANDMGLKLNVIIDFLKHRNIFSYLDNISNAGKRAADIVANMLQFSRKSQFIISFEDINHLIENSIDIASKDYDLEKKYDFRSVNIVKEYGKDIPHIKCFKVEIEQVLLNILKNSAQAMAEVSKENYNPEIRIKTSKLEKFVEIEIFDNGPGMDEGTKKRIFEPFFTTKDIKTGTGLGLSVSYFIITSHHNGIISMESILKKGTKFNIKLPF